MCLKCENSVFTCETFIITSDVFIADITESGVRLKLTIVDSVGYGDQINKEDRWEFVYLPSREHVEELPLQINRK